MTQAQQNLEQQQEQQAYQRFQQAQQLKNRPPAPPSESEQKSRLKALWPDAGDSFEERLRIRLTQIPMADGLALERLFGNSDQLPVAYLEVGLKATRAVGRIELRDRLGQVVGWANAFLVAPNLLLTNNHVLETPEAAHWSVAQFNLEHNYLGQPRAIRSFRLLPQRLFLTNAELDYTLVAVKETDADGFPLDEFGYLTLNDMSGKILEGEFVSLIQHPGGGPKTITLRESRVVHVFEQYVHFTTSNQGDSVASGAPLFNDNWQVVALTSQRIPDPNLPGHFIAHEGIRISHIVKDLIQHRKRLPNNQQELLDSVYDPDLHPLINNGQSLDFILDVVDQQPWRARPSTQRGGVVRQPANGARNP